MLSIFAARRKWPTTISPAILTENDLFFARIASCRFPWELGKYCVEREMLLFHPV
jgi:hypothetical protein